MIQPDAHPTLRYADDAELNELFQQTEAATREHGSWNDSGEDNGELCYQFTVPGLRLRRIVPATHALFGVGSELQVSYYPEQIEHQSLTPPRCEYMVIKPRQSPYVCDWTSLEAADSDLPTPIYKTNRANPIKPRYQLEPSTQMLKAIEIGLECWEDLGCNNISVDETEALLAVMAHAKRLAQPRLRHRLGWMAINTLVAASTYKAP